jgi:phosphomannomutase/phosphoglucomutase
MLPKPCADLRPNSVEFETIPLVSPLGFREYDARWLFPEQINLLGMQAVGFAVGARLCELRDRPAVVVGHDYRSYSAGLKQALIVGLLSAGCDVHDIGLSITPMAYFAQFALGVPAVAMVTASHNENGWTGIKLGAEPPLTFGPEEMALLRDRVLAGETPGSAPDAGGRYTFVPDMRERYIADLVEGRTLRRRLKVVVACGNGTASLFAPRVLEVVGAEVVPLHCEPDHSFPHYNTNPEDTHMLHDVAAKVREVGADLGLAFDGDGDRCGAVDDTGEEIFADKMGVLIARGLAADHPGATFLADVKSTGLFRTDPVLHQHGARFALCRTGHSYVKRQARDEGALAAFEKSGHYVFGPPLGRGYDDGCVSALMICAMLDRNPGVKLSELKATLRPTWLSPTMSPFCPDERKYEVVDKITAHYRQLAAQGGQVIGQAIQDIVTINGVRVELADGTWGLVRASSNKPSLVVVVESPVSDSQMHAIFGEIDQRLREYPEVGQYDQVL